MVQSLLTAGRTPKIGPKNRTPAHWGADREVSNLHLAGRQLPQACKPASACQGDRIFHVEVLHHLTASSRDCGRYDTAIRVPTQLNRI